MTTAREMLNRLDDFFTSDAPRQEREKLWDVLSALRGPDIHDHSRKLEATIPIRRAAFPKLADSACRFDLGGAFGTPTLSAFSRPTGDSDEHFNFHIICAAEALGLVAEVPVA